MIYEKSSYVSGSMCDSKLKLSIIAADEIVENSVSELMGDLGIDGIVAMEKYKAMWVMTKNQVRFLRRPGWREGFVIKCFISRHSAITINIDTVIESESGEVLIKARTELVAIDLESGRIRKTETVGFTADMEYPVPTEGLELTRFPKEGGDKIGMVTVQSTSIDYCNHTNNVEYLRFMLNTYHAEHFKMHEPDLIEIHYANQSFEGEKLEIYRTEIEKGDLFSILRDGVNITSCKVIWRAEAKCDAGNDVIDTERICGVEQDGQGAG